MKISVLLSKKRTGTDLSFRKITTHDLLQVKQSKKQREINVEQFPNYLLTIMDQQFNKNSRLRDENH